MGTSSKEMLGFNSLHSPTNCNGFQWVPYNFEELVCHSEDKGFFGVCWLRMSPQTCWTTLDEERSCRGEMGTLNCKHNPTSSSSMTSIHVKVGTNKNMPNFMDFGSCKNMERLGPMTQLAIWYGQNQNSSISIVVSLYLRCCPLFVGTTLGFSCLTTNNLHLVCKCF